MLASWVIVPSLHHKASGVKVVYPILGGWFYAKVDKLNPNRGLMIVRSQLNEDDFTRIDFDIS
jgi:hypothetical protein